MRKVSMFTRKALVYLTAGAICGIAFVVVAGDGPRTAGAQEFGSESADTVYTSGTAVVEAFDYTQVVSGPLVLSVSEFTFGYECHAAIFEGGCSYNYWSEGRVGTARPGDVLGPNEVLCIAKTDNWGNSNYCNYRYAGHLPYYYVSGPRR